MKSEESQITFDMERQLIKTGMLFAHQLHAVAFNWKIVYIFSSIEEMSEKEYVQNYKFFYTDPTIALSPEKLDSLYAELNKLRNKKMKTKNDLILLGRYEKSFVNVKAAVLRAFDQILAENKLESILGFAKEKVLEFYDEKAAREHGILKFQKTLIEEFSTPDLYHFVTTNDKSKRIIDTENLKTVMDNPEHIFFNHICLIPCLDSLSYHQLKIIRNEFQEQLFPFYKALKEAEKEFEQIPLTIENVDKVNNRFDELFLPLIPPIEAMVRDNIYIQQIENSSSDHKTYELNIAFGTIETIVKIYGQTKVIALSEYENIFEKITYTRDIKSCCLFFFLAEVEG